MPFRDLLKKKDKVQTTANEQHGIDDREEFPVFKIIRSDTNTEELLSAPSYPNAGANVSTTALPPTPRSRGSSRAGDPDDSAKDHKRLSERLGLHRPLKSRTSSANSTNLPSNLPEIQGAYKEDFAQEDREAQWEQRATILAIANPNSPPRQTLAREMPGLSVHERTGRSRSVSDLQSDVNIQEAIRLHEVGRLEDATRMFKQLADNGNVLSEVLFGLSLRHGWGCNKDEARAFTYLSSAASDSAALEAEALKAGLKKGGVAKGELVLAIFELGNCYRYGWGTSIDKVAAR